MFINKNSKKVIVCFAGHSHQFGLIEKFEFVKILDFLFEDCDKYFFTDQNREFYHLGIKGFSTDVESTAAYLKSILSNYNNITFMGVSAGGHAAILYGCILNVDKVIAFIPQTILHENYSHNNLRDLLLQNNLENKTHHYLYGSLNDPDPLHSISHIENIEDLNGVECFKYPHINLPTMKQNGELNDILRKHIY